MAREAVLDWDLRSFKRFDARVTFLQHRIPPACVKALTGVVGEAVLRDALNVPPTVPKAVPPMGGSLRESGTVHLTRVTPTGASLDIVFDQPYAAPMHAGRWETGPLAGVEVQYWTEPGSGPGWLGSKLLSFKEKYITLACLGLKRFLGM